MRLAPAAALAAFLLGGCATDRVLLLENEGGAETGSVAVLYHLLAGEELGA